MPAGAKDRADLRDEEFGVLKEDPSRTPPHERIRLTPAPQVRDRLVAPQVERPDRDRLTGRIGDDLPVILVLFLFARHVVMGHEEVLGPEETDTGRSHLVGRLGIGQVIDVGEQLDVRAVGASCRQVAIGEQPVLGIEELALNFAIRRGRFLVGPDDHHAVAAVDNDHVAGLDFRQDPVEPRDRRNAAAPRQDRGMTRAAAQLGDDPRDRQVAEVHRLAGKDLMRHQDDRLIAVAVAVDSLDRLGPDRRSAGSGATRSSGSRRECRSFARETSPA